MINVYLYALNEEDESMREQYSASPSVIVFCHSEHEGDDQNVDVHDLWAFFPLCIQMLWSSHKRKCLPSRLIGAESSAERIAR